jgi:predicted enzyme related to lactoylglutathione lyase
MSSTVLGVSFDARNAVATATFWSEVLGRPVADGASVDHAVLVTGDITISGPRIAFHRVPEGKVAKNRVHFDLVTDDIGQETARLLALGATKLNTITSGGHWVTFADPEGNEFDVIAR